MDFGGPNLGTLLHEGKPSNFYIWAPHTAMGCFFLRSLWHLLECTHNPKKRGYKRYMDVKAIPMATHCQAFLFRVFWGTIPALIKHHTSCWGCLIFATGVGAVCGWKWWPSGWCQYNWCICSLVDIWGATWMNPNSVRNEVVHKTGVHEYLTYLFSPGFGWRRKVILKDKLLKTIKGIAW